MACIFLGFILSVHDKMSQTKFFVLQKKKQSYRKVWHAHCFCYCGCLKNSRTPKKVEIIIKEIESWERLLEST